MTQHASASDNVMLLTAADGKMAIRPNTLLSKVKELLSYLEVVKKPAELCTASKGREFDLFEPSGEFIVFLMLSVD